MSRISVIWSLLFASSTFAQTSDSIGCFVSGECTKSLVLSTSSTTSLEECANICNQLPECTHFTFNPTNGADNCQAFQNCIELSPTSCPECISGDAGCRIASCFDSGLCIGNELEVTDATSPEQCLSLCADNSECQWFSFQEEDKSCSLTSDCRDLQDCSGCFYGSTECALPEVPYLLTVGGFVQSRSSLSTVELIDLSASNDSCYNLPRFPLDVYSAFAIRRYSGEPMICGGYNTQFVKDCYYYTDGGWIRDDNEIIYLTESPFVVDLGLGEYWIVGGLEPFSEYYKNGEFSRGPYLPESFSFPCGARIDRNTYLFVGFNLEGTAFMYDNTTKTWTSIPSPSEIHFAPTCGIITSKSGEQEFVVAGGRRSDYTFSNQTEILNLETMTWRTGSPLPKARGFSTTVPTRESFISIGGYNEIDPTLDDILEYDPINEVWKVLPNGLGESRIYTAALPVSRDEFLC